MTKDLKMDKVSEKLKIGLKSKYKIGIVSGNSEAESIDKAKLYDNQGKNTVKSWSISRYTKLQYVILMIEVKKPGDKTFTKVPVNQVKVN